MQRHPQTFHFCKLQNGLGQQEMLMAANAEETARFQRPFAVFKKPHYEIYKWARTAL